MAIDFPRLVYREQKLLRKLPQPILGDFKRLGNAGNAQQTGKIALSCDKCSDFSRLSRPADIVSDIQSKKVTMFNIAVDSIEINVVGIDKIRPRVIQRLDRRIGFPARIDWLTVNKVMFTI